MFYAKVLNETGGRAAKNQNSGGTFRRVLFPLESKFPRNFMGSIPSLEGERIGVWSSP